MLNIYNKIPFLTFWKSIFWYVARNPKILNHFYTLSCVSTKKSYHEDFRLSSWNHALYLILNVKFFETFCIYEIQCCQKTFEFEQNWLKNIEFKKLLHVNWWLLSYQKDYWLYINTIARTPVVKPFGAKHQQFSISFIHFNKWFVVKLIRETKINRLKPLLTSRDIFLYYFANFIININYLKIS